jgi:hypothetical protein
MVNPFDVILVLIYSLISWIIIMAGILYVLYLSRGWIFGKVKDAVSDKVKEIKEDVKDLGKDSVNWVIGEVKSIF